ncbi:MAG: hypothetical protein AB8I08_08995 [Sandaracinaceae bacterium]
MSDNRDTSEKSIGQKVEEMWQGLLDALESLVTPEPQLIPVRVRPTPPRRRRRRR